MNTVLIANSDPSEAEAIHQRLSRDFLVRFAANSASLQEEAECDLILLDANFTELQGIDFLMEAISTIGCPVLFVTPPDDIKCAIEATRSGAYNYIFSNENYRDLLPYAIKDAIQSYCHARQQEQTIIALRARIAQLEKQLAVPGNASGHVPGNTHTSHSPAPPTETRQAALVKLITGRLGRGEINLPACPRTAERLRQMIDAEADFDEITLLLREDQAIVSKLIAVANSPLYSIGAATTSLEQAVMRIGLKTCSRYVQIIENRSLYPDDNSELRDAMLALCRHAVACAHAASVISMASGVGKPEEMFSLGLLHDIGSVLLTRIIDDLANEDGLKHGLDPDELMEFIHEHHTGFGKAVLQRWSMPPLFVDGVRFHEQPASSSKPSKELWLLNFSDRLAHALGHGDTEVDLDTLLASDVARNLGINDQNRQPMLDEITLLIEASQTCV